MDPRRLVAQDGWCALCIALAVAIHGSGVGVPILAPDGAVYASIAKTMVQRHNYLELVVQGQAWLDKRVLGNNGTRNRCKRSMLGRKCLIRFPKGSYT